MFRLSCVVLFGAALTWGQKPSTNPANDNSQTTNAQVAPTNQVPIPADSSKLEPISTVKPIYPPEAAQQGFEGRVDVKLSVTETGDVDSVEVLDGNAVLGAACADALKQWKFRPFIKNGKAIRVSANYPCNFVASGSPPLVPVEDRTQKGKESAAGSVPQAMAANPLPTNTTDGGAVPDSVALVLVKKIKPSYSIDAEEQQIQGEVQLQIVTTETGDVGDVKVISGNPILAPLAVSAVKKWRFEPFIRNGKAIKACSIVYFDFVFKDKIIYDKYYSGSAANRNNGPTQTSAVPAAAAAALPTTPGSNPQALTVSQGITRGMVLYKVAPVYPPAAKRARIQGVVVLAAVIGKDGRIVDLHVVTGPPELVDAAIGAVQQWRYKPYLLNGEPKEVQTTVTVNFTLR